MATALQGVPIATIKLFNHEEKVIIDACDYDLVTKYKWRISNKNGTGYAITTVRRGEWSKPLFMHHLIVAKKPGMVVDHINGNKLDNRRCNLRACTERQNCRNKRKLKPTASKYSGVIRDKKRWTCKVRADGVVYHCGNWASEEEAAIAHDRAAMYLHGDFAYLNFPERGLTAADPKSLISEAKIISKSGQQSKYTGVSPTRHGKWTAAIMHCRTRITLGNWPTELQAALAHDCGCKFLNHHGNDGLNLPGECSIPKSPEVLRLEARCHDS